MTNNPRSSKWFDQDGVGGFIHRASMRAEGLGHGRDRTGVLLAGGLPVEFPVMTLGENLMKPTAMLYRNLMSMDVEESIRAYPFDAVVLMGGCDKTTPGLLMGAAGVGLPAIVVTGRRCC